MWVVIGVACDRKWRSPSLIVVSLHRVTVPVKGNLFLDEDISGEIFNYLELPN